MFIPLIYRLYFYIIQFISAFGSVKYKIYILFCLTFSRLLHASDIRFLKQNLAYKRNAWRIYKDRCSHRLKLIGGRREIFLFFFPLNIDKHFGPQAGSPTTTTTRWLPWRPETVQRLRRGVTENHHEIIQEEVKHARWKISHNYNKVRLLQAEICDTRNWVWFNLLTLESMVWKWNY